MDNQTYQRRAKLKMRLKRHLGMVLDSLTRFNDCVDEVDTDYAELNYLSRQACFAAEGVQQLLDRLADYQREYPAEVEQRGC